MEPSTTKCRKSSYFNNSLYFSLFIMWIFLFLSGARIYPGSVVIYSFYSFAYLVLLISGTFWKITYGYVFLAIMVWLGFWLKTVVHLLFNYPFIEPTGLFKGTSEEWDSVLFIASIGATGIIIARIFFSVCFSSRSTLTVEEPAPPPWWYKYYKTSLWFVLAVSMIAFSVTNIYFSFQQIGLVPKTIIWPLNAIFSWLISTGFAMTGATLLWWEFLSKKANSNVIYIILLEAAISSISLLSRGLFIFHITPLYFSVFLNRKLIPPLGLKWTATLLSFTTIVFLSCYPLINSIRDSEYSGVAMTMPWQMEKKSLIDGKEYTTDAGTYLTETGINLKKSIMKLAAFSVDRWIGLEGLMASSAYPEKSPSLLFKLATEKAEIGKASIFQDIALSHYRFMDMRKFSFASLPGPISFFYLSNSLWILVGGMIFVTLFVITSEILIYKILKNPFLAALWGSIVSTAIAQLGINTPGLVIHLLLCSIGILTLFLFQNSFFITRFRIGKHAD
ncbi:hypothetical protein [Pseudomonas fluorescens]|uniref:hypothetical protein n=1 Tax=Pseudomonas fluorescens TaxID=294 RepID=UPI00031F5987|nr:hypothetical protein [Pseudomonas fluorescens]